MNNYLIKFYNTCYNKLFVLIFFIFFLKNKILLMKHLFKRKLIINELKCDLIDDLIN